MRVTATEARLYGHVGPSASLIVAGGYFYDALSHLQFTDFYEFGGDDESRSTSYYVSRLPFRIINPIGGK